MMKTVAVFAVLAVSALADNRLEAYPACQQHKEICDEVVRAIDSGNLFPPVVSSTGVLAEEGAAPIQPVVLMHGLGDAGSNPGMQSLAKSIMDAYPGSYAVAVDVANSLKSFFSEIQPQVDEFNKVVNADPKLANGFQAIGLSQGGIVVRGYIQQYNSPPVSKFISICGVVNGVRACPLQVDILPFVCKEFAKDPYNFLDNALHLSFADYFVTFWNETEYLHGNKYLAPLNNELPTHKNATYAKMIESLDLMYLVEATEDTVVYPYEAEQFGGWKFTDNPDDRTLYSMTEAPFYDNFGLKTLNEAGKIKFNQFKGNHLQFSNEFWTSDILPYLK